MIEVRNLEPNEPLPDFADEWFKRCIDKPLPMRDWFWVAIKDGKVVGYLVASPMFGMINFVRFRTLPEAPKAAMLMLLRECFSACRQRGYFAFVGVVNTDIEAERQIIGIARRNGAKQLPIPIVMLAGELKSAGNGRRDLI